MKKIEKRTVICLALTLSLLLGLALFLVRFLLDGGDWASFAANRHLYNSQGQLSVGRVLDRDEDVLSWVDESGQRRYYSNATVRKATLHAVGDPSGAIGTGALVAFAGLPPFIVTLGTYTALRGAAYLLADGTTVINSNINFEWIGNNYLGPIPWLVAIALAVIVVCWFILRRTTLGVHIYAVGGNMQAARLTGIKVWLVLLFVYGMSGLLSGLGGVMSASRLYSANGNLGTGYELDAIAAVILGGTSFVGGIGTITGTLVGALIIATLNNGMTLMGVSYFWQLVIKGAVIIIAVLIDKYRTRHHQSA